MIKCFEVVHMVVEEANKRFSPLWKVSEEKYKALYHYCSVIDKISESYNAEAYDVEVDEIKMTISIAIEMPEFTVDDHDELVKLIIEKSLSFSLYQNDSGNIELKLVFPSVWTH